MSARSRLAASTATAALLILGFSGAAAAQSACDPANPANGATVVCSGTGAGIVDDGLDDATITVETGAVIDGGNNQAFEFDDDVTFTNAGTITSGGDHAVQGDNGVTVTNTGTIISTNADGVNIDNDGVITNSGTIEGADDGVQLDEDGTVTNEAAGSITGDDRGVTMINGTVTNAGTILGDAGDAVRIEGEGEVTNSGTITSTGGDGVQIDGDGTLTNRAGGTITGGADGAKIEGDGIFTNAGIIEGADDGVQVDGSGFLINETTGIIRATDEGVNFNTADAVVTNHGLIEAGDDGINVAGNATVINTGTIRATDTGDGIDIDWGTIDNSGLIEALGGEDGIDFDPVEGDNDPFPGSTVTNTGTIRGNHAITTDELDVASQTVINSGTLIGTGGVAVNLGGGDDVLRLLHGSVIEGTIDMGAGNDTLSVEYNATSYLELASPVETVTVTAADAYLVTDTAVLTFTVEDVADAAGHVAARDLAMAFAAPVLRTPAASGVQAAQGFGGAGGQVWASVNLDGLGQDEGAGLALGYDVALGAGAGGIWLGHATSDATTSTTVGLRYALPETAGVTAAATLFAGVTSTDGLMGSAGADGTLWGIAGRAGYLLREPAPGRAGFDLVAEGGFVRHEIDAQVLSGMGGAELGGGTSDSGWLRLEAGVPVMIGQGVLRGYLAATHLSGSADALSLELDGMSINPGLDSGNGLDDTRVALGAGWDARLSGGGAVQARIEAEWDQDGDADLALGLTWRMALGR